MISSASSTFEKIGPGTKVQVRRPVPGSSSMMSVPVMSDGIRSGVNWMRRNSRPSVWRERPDQQRLGGARQAGDQAMAADEQRDHHLLDHFVLADDHAPHLGDDVVPYFLEPRDAVLQLGGVECVAVVVDIRILCLIPSRVQFEQQLLGRLEAGRGFERRQHFVARVVGALGGLQRARQLDNARRPDRRCRRPARLETRESRPWDS